MTADSDTTDFTAFFDATWARTLACSYAMCGDLAAAEDIAQEAYSRAWPRWQQLSRYDDPAAWVRRVASHLAVSRWRRARTAMVHLARSRPPDPAPPPDETTVLLVDALRQLPGVQRRAIVLHHLAQLPVAEVARLEHCPEGTVKARLSRGRVSLAEILRPTSPARRGTTNGEPSHA